MNRTEKGTPFKVPAGTVLTCATGKYTVLGFRDGKERFYTCKYENDVNPVYNVDQAEIREKDIDHLYNYQK
ncbi:MAG: hypothetical protein LBL07_03835 [Tannerella sp.]|jgi:hypothetical protein|nr:hypothetical protein [Tannerella sp.]